MIAEQMAAKLHDAAHSVLDMMCSAPVLADEEFPPQGAQNPLLVGLDFDGEARGHFAMAVELCAAEALAGGFLGMSESPERQQIIEVLSELANMLCGHFLGQLSFTESFRLSSPEELDFARLARDRQTRPGHSYQRSVRLAAGILSMNVVIEGTALPVGCEAAEIEAAPNQVVG